MSFGKLASTQIPGDYCSCAKGWCCRLQRTGDKSKPYKCALYGDELDRNPRKSDDCVDALRELNDE